MDDFFRYMELAGPRNTRGERNRGAWIRPAEGCLAIQILQRIRAFFQPPPARPAVEKIG
jgi:hypothetical protein